MRKALLFLLLLTGWATLGSAVDVGADPSSREAFEAWLRGNPARGKAYRELRNFLVKEGVEDVIPVWQLARVDVQNAARCDAGYFALPPRAQWPQIVPALRLVRDKVVPVTGSLEVVSGWRSPAINTCIGGATRSAHLDFKALDLVAVERSDRRKLFADLCAMQRRAGAKTGMGLGAYFDPADLKRNTEGRFHIDANGYRSWGFDYTFRTNPCPELG